MKLLVTGGTGFVGSHVLRALDHHPEFEVHCVQRREPRQPPSRTTWHRGDLLDLGQMRSVVSAVRPDALLHLAWDVAPPSYTGSMSNLAWCSASISLVEQFIRCGGSRLVAVGTCAEYDWSLGGGLSEQATPVRPQNLYAHSKHVLQLALAAACESVGISWAWARLFFLFGPGEHPSRFVPSILLPLLSPRPIQVENPWLKRDYLYAADAAEALVAILGTNASGCLNVGSGRSIALGDFARSIAAEMDPTVSIHYGSGQSSRAVGDFWADTGKLMAVTGWQPRASLAEALRASIAWWREQAP